MNTTPEPTDAPTGAVTAENKDASPVFVPVPAAVTLELQKSACEMGLSTTEQQTLAEAFRPVFIKAHEAILAAAGVAESVKDATCVREIKKSRECRLAIRAVRIEGEKVHKSQKESAIRFGRAVDGFKNILLAELGPVEEALDAAEKTAERAEAARLIALRQNRDAQLVPLLDGSPIVSDLSQLSEAAFQKLLEDHQLLRKAKIEAAEKAEADRLAKEAADRAERDRINLENARLKAEADATAKRLEEERQVREKQARKEREAQEAERQRVEAERKAEREKAEAEKRAIEEKAKAERLAAEAKARKEREAIEAAAVESARKAREESERLKAELAAKEKAEADAVAKIEKERKAKEAAERAAAIAPDKIKLTTYLAAVKALPIPEIVNTSITAAIAVRRDEFIALVERMIVSLDTPNPKETPL